MIKKYIYLSLLLLYYIQCATKLMQKCVVVLIKKCTHIQKILYDIGNEYYLDNIYICFERCTCKIFTRNGVHVEV